MSFSTMLIETENLALTRLGSKDLDGFAKLNADPEVMRFFPSPYSRKESEAILQKYAKVWEENGFGPFAVREKENDTFLGFVGIAPVGFEARFTPAIEAFWRFMPDAWGKGIAMEAAKEVLRTGFLHHDLPEIIAFTASINAPSRRLIHRLGFQRDEMRDFRHPNIARNSPLSHHEFYYMTKARFYTLT